MKKPPPAGPWKAANGGEPESPHGVLRRKEPNEPETRMPTATPPTASEQRRAEAECIARIVRAYADGDTWALRNATFELLRVTGGKLPPLELPASFGSHLRHGSSWLFGEVGE